MTNDEKETKEESESNFIDEIIEIPDSYFLPEGEHTLDNLFLEHEVDEREDGSVWINIMDFQKFKEWLKKAMGL